MISCSILTLETKIERFRQMLNHMNKAEGVLSELGTLKGDVPVPIIRRLDNGTIRTHVEFEDNDIIGQRA